MIKVQITSESHYYMYMMHVISDNLLTETIPNNNYLPSIIDF